MRTLFAAEGYTDGPFLERQTGMSGEPVGQGDDEPAWRADELVITVNVSEVVRNGSGEIPLRAARCIARPVAGSIDPSSEGGKTPAAPDGSIHHYDLPSGGRFFANAYAQYYRFDLFTNFTFFLTDPVNGDGFTSSRIGA